MNTKINKLTIALLCLLLTSQLYAAEYTVAVRAHRGTELAIEQWQSTVDALNKSIKDHHFILQPIVSLTTISDYAKKNKFDFVLTNPSSYVEISELYDGIALATLNNKRADTAQFRFGSVIFTHALNTDILSIADLENKTLMAVSEPAFGGWRVAWLEMLNQGFDPYQDLKSLTFTKSKTQPEVVYAVLKRKVDVGVVRTDLLERMEKIGKIDMRYLRIINIKDVRDFPFFLSTDLYPEWAFAALPHIPEHTRNKVGRLLLSIKEQSEAAIQGKYVGWIPPADYSSVNALMKKLRVGPYKRKRPAKH